MENINLIRKIAWSFHYTTGLELDDLFQEAALAYLEALKTYNPQKGKITTYLWHCMSKRLKNYLKEQDNYKCKHHNDTGVDYIEDTTINTSEEMNLFWEGLTDDAYQIAKVVLASPKPYLEHDYRPQSINRIRRVMRNYHWPWNKTREGLNDLRLAYSKRTTPWL